MIQLGFRSSGALLAFCAAVTVVAPALAASRWEPAASGASIILPAPAKAKGVVGGSLFCREQQWAFLLRTDREAPADAAVRLVVGEEEFPGTVLPGADALTIEVPARILVGLKEAGAMRVEIGTGKAALSARFSLAGSRQAIEAAAPLCSAPNMSGFEAVALEAAGPAVDAAGPLMEEELALFREATTDAAPVLSAALIEGEAGRRLLFASLCGSTRYYGESGCTTRGFAAEGGAAWRVVFEAEGMHLFRDARNASSGWPNLATLPIAGEVKRLRWAWDGQQYQVTDDAALAGGPPAVLDQLRTGATTGE